MWRYTLVLFALSLIISIALLNPNIKNQSMAFLLSTQRVVLSQLEMEGATGQRYKVVKVRNMAGLAIEIYKLFDNESMLLDSQQLTDKKDAFFKFGDARHNLFLKDINNDGQSEIILPSIDKNMKARLNVFIFDFENESLQKVTQH